MDPFLIPADLDIAGAPDLHATLCAEVAQGAQGASFALDLSNDCPTQPAVQLLLAAARAAEADGRVVTFGPLAEPIVTMTTGPARADGKG